MSDSDTNVLEFVKPAAEVPAGAAGEDARPSAASSLASRRALAAAEFAGMSRDDLLEVALAGCDALDERERLINMLCDLLQHTAGCGIEYERQLAALRRSMVVFQTAAQHARAVIEQRQPRRLAVDFLSCIIEGAAEHLRVQVPAVEWPQADTFRPKPVV